MPDIDEILAQHADEIERERSKYREEGRTEIPRDPLRRPWNEVPDILEEPVRTNPPLDRSPWYASWRNFFEALSSNRRLVLTSFVIFLSVTGVGAYFVPVRYNSALQLYAPDKSDNISSRMQLFANRVEFASFPLNFKVPLGLIVRRLKTPAARAWVLSQYAQKYPESGLDVDSVSVETFYAEGSELLVIQAYANDAVASAALANLYWDYLENEIKAMTDDHLQKVDQWIQITAEDLQQKVRSFESTGETAEAVASPDKAQVIGRLSESFAEGQMKLLKAERELDEINKISRSSDMSLLLNSHDAELKDLARIREALPTSEAKAAIDVRIQEALKNNTSEKLAEIASLKLQLKKLRPELSSLERSASASRLQDLHLRDVAAKRETYQSQLDELEKLKDQIGIESRLTHLRLKPIQVAAIDYASRRPMISVLVATCVLLSVFLTLVMLSLVMGFSGSVAADRKPVRI